MLPSITFTGPTRYRLLASTTICRSLARVAASRARRGPLLPSWNYAVEAMTAILRNRLQTAFTLDVVEARSFLNAVVVSSPALTQVSIEEHEDDGFRGSWFTPQKAAADVVLLYFHGGGYAFYPKASYKSFIAEIAVTTGLRTYALDYRLAPEHKFPAQLDDALAAYRYISASLPDSRRIAIGGDSAGGNLSLALLLRLRELGITQPAVALLLSPATEFDVIRESMFSNESYDWIDVRMLARFAAWFCDPANMSNPLVSPTRADLKGLAPIHIQAGGREILLGGIQSFVERAGEQGADVTLETWDDMNHVFHLLGRLAPQSSAALNRAAEVIHKHLALRAATS